MNHKANKYYSFILLGILIFFTTNSILGNIAFGSGLGDIFCHPILWLITLTYIITFAKNRKNERKLLISNAVFTIPIFWIALSATLWRGPEYRWNGEIFYPPKSSKENRAKERNRRESAIDSLQIEVQKNPNNTKALVRIGELKYVLGNDEEALKYLEEALIKGDSSKYTRSKLARQYVNNGLKTKAIEQYEEILKIDSLNKSANFNLRRLKNEKRK